MTRENYETINRLVAKIDDLSNSADVIREIFDNFADNGGTAKLYSNTSGKSYETALSADMARIVYRDILSSYNNSIVQAKEELDKIIDNCRR